METKPVYEAPQVTSYTDEEILAELGTAQAYVNNGVTRPPAVSPF